MDSIRPEPRFRKAKAHSPLFATSTAAIPTTLTTISPGLSRRARHLEIRSHYSDGPVAVRKTVAPHWGKRYRSTFTVDAKLPVRILTWFTPENQYTCSGSFMPEPCNINPSLVPLSPVRTRSTEIARRSHVWEQFRNCSVLPSCSLGCSLGRSLARVSHQFLRGFGGKIVDHAFPPAADI